MLRQDEKYQRIPIIMISARRDVKTITRAAELGCDSFIIKPFKLVELAKRIYIELFSVDLAFVQQSFSRIDMITNTVLQQKGLSHISAVHWDAYPFKHEEVEFVLVLARGLKKGALIKMPEVEIREKSEMYFKMPNGHWRKVWPK
jgi:response regulator RpfG family c-di-GMP phosphodiesterase